MSLKLPSALNGYLKRILFGNKFRLNNISGKNPCVSLQHVNFTTKDNVQNLKKGKLFLESENNFAHSMLEKYPDYSDCIVKFSEYDCLLTSAKGEKIDYILRKDNWSEISGDEICSLFRTVSIDAALHSKLPISDERYNKMCSSIRQRFTSMTDEQLAQILCYLKLWPMCESPKSPNFYEFWKELDNVCSVRRNSWDLTKIFYFIDLWYCSHLIRQSDFVFRTVVSLGKKPNRLQPKHVVQYLFYLNALRTVHKGITMYNVEHRFEHIVKDLSIEEIGIALMGFFKTQTLLRSEKLIAFLMRRLINEITEVPEITLSSFLKAIRMSIPIPLWPMLPELLDSVETQLNRLSIQCCVHVALVATRPKLLHQSTLTQISQKLVDSISNARLKDMEKIIFSLTITNFDPKVKPDLYEAVIQEIERPEREEELQKYPKSLASLLHYLCLRSVYSTSLISRVLNMKFVRETYGKNNFLIGREILSIDTCVELECPEYNGPRLPKDIANYLSKRYSCYRPDVNYKLSKHDQFEMDVRTVLEEVLGREFVTSKYVLPNQARADLIFSVDSNGNPLEIPSHYQNIKDFTGTLKAPQGNWYCIVVGNKNMFLFDSILPTRETNCKLRHLACLGYKPIMITWRDWPLNQKEQKLDYIRNLIFGKELKQNKKDGLKL